MEKSNLTPYITFIRAIPARVASLYYKFMSKVCAFKVALNYIEFVYWKFHHVLLLAAFVLYFPELCDAATLNHVLPEI